MEQSNEGPVFVVGMNGSGTTMLLDHLNNHSELYGYPVETRVLPYYIKQAARYGDLGVDENLMRLWDDMRSLFPFRLANKNEPVPLPDNWRSLPRGVSQIFNEIMMYFAEREGKARWCEKSPMYVLHILELSRRFPDAKFVHVIRDGRDCAASFHRRSGYNPKHTVWRWKQVIMEGQRQGALLPTRYCEVFYEKITADPEAELRRVCDFLVLPFETTILESSRHRPSMKGTSAAQIIPNSGRYRTYFKEETQNAMEKIAGRKLHESGYKANDSDGDATPSAVLLMLWTTQDFLTFLWEDTKKKLRQRGKRPWYIVFGRIRSSLQQRMARKL